MQKTTKSGNARFYKTNEQKDMYSGRRGDGWNEWGIRYFYKSIKGGNSLLGRLR